MNRWGINVSVIYSKAYACCALKCVVATYLLNEGRVAAVPGSACGLSPYVRISTATSEAMLTEAVARIDAAAAQVE